MICGVLNFIFHIYHNSSINSTIIIGNTQRLNHKNNWVLLYSGKNNIILIINPKYANIPKTVGTGFLTHLRSAPGLSKKFIFLNKYFPAKNIAVIVINEYKKAIEIGYYIKIVFTLWKYINFSIEILFEFFIFFYILYILWFIFEKNNYMKNTDAVMNEKTELRVFLADIAPKDLNPAILEDRMAELENLVNTYGWLVILKKIQRRDLPDLKTYVGKGKLEEIIEEMLRNNSNLLIVGNALKPSQIFKINEALREASDAAWLKEPMLAWDRIDLILKIFGKHADSNEAKLQIELAAIKHMWPRITGMGMELSRQWWSSGSGGWATRWLGETNTERMKRHLKEKQLKIKVKLKEVEKMRNLHRLSRQKKWLPIIGIVWYTNTGKSTLLNAFTKKWVLAENKLFATLWTNVGKMYLFTDIEKGIGKEILLNDTIGFIRDLPPKLIDAFSSTLEDSVASDFLLHVIDASDLFIQERIKVVNEILDDIWAKQKRIMVFNKIDLVDEQRIVKLQKMYKWNVMVFVSVANDIWLEQLKDVIVQNLI